MRCIRDLFLAAALCFSVPCAAGEGRNTQLNRMSGVVLHGVHHARTGALAEHLKTGGDSLSGDWLETMTGRVTGFYADRGFLLASLDSVRIRTHPGGREVHLWIDEGPQFRIRELAVEGLPDPENRLLRNLSAGEGDVFREALLIENIETILSGLENSGYPLSSVEVIRLLPVRDEMVAVDVTLRVDAGDPVPIDTVMVRGNRNTRTEVILREARVRKGSLYRRDRIRGIRNLLERTGYFSRVDEPEVFFTDRGAAVMIGVEEGKTGTIDGMIGYQPSEREGVQGTFTGRLQFTFPNLFGTGRFFETFWEKKDAHSQSMRVRYEEPWVFGFPVFLGGGLMQEIRDTTYVERNWHLSVRYRPRAALSLEMELGRRSVLPDSLGALLYRVIESKSWLFSAGMDYTTLDDRLVPGRGVRYRTRITFGSKHNLGPRVLLEEGIPARTTMRLIEADAVAVLPLPGKRSLFLSLTGREIRTGEPYVGISEQIRFGGARTLRGYAEDSFRGSLAAWMNAEIRQFIAKRTWIFAFLDAGMYQRKEPDGAVARGMKTGYGLGIRLDTRLGLFGLDFGLGEGDRLMQGKIHVGLVNEF